MVERVKYFVDLTFIKILKLSCGRMFSVEVAKMEEILNGLLDFLNKSHTEFNATYNIKEILDNNNFIELQEGQNFKIERGKNYYLIRNDSSVIAFKVPLMIHNFAFKICASHLDSPCLKLKMEKAISSQNYLKLNVEKYGGAIISTWLDKPLSVAGRVFYKKGEEIKREIIDFNKPILIIPNVAIHFNRSINDGYIYNIEKDMKPIFALGNDENSFLEAIANLLNINKDDILSYDLECYNFTSSLAGGLNNEFLMSPRIDNLESAYLSLKGFIESNNENDISVFVSFNNEEVGSQTFSGADSDILKNTLKRISNSLGFSENDYFVSLAKSFLLSIDNGHAIHPNHQEFSDLNSPVYLNKGVIIKFNSNMAYTSDALTSSYIIDICKKNNIPYQLFYNRSDVRGGSTLGALSISQLGIKSVDIGCPQLAMHSNYETSGTKDVQYMFELIKAYYLN